jgi:hypothetical protein
MKHMKSNPVNFINIFSNVTFRELCHLFFCIIPFSLIYLYVFHHCTDSVIQDILNILKLSRINIAMPAYYFTFWPPPADQSDGNLWEDVEVLPTPDFDWKPSLSLPNFHYYSKLKEDVICTSTCLL